MNLRDQLVRRHGEDNEGANPLAALRMMPVLPQAGDSEGRAVFHRHGVGLFCPRAFGRAPLEETINGHDAAALCISRAEGRELRHGFGAGVDWLAAAVGISAAMRDQAPAQQIQRALAGFVVLADHIKELARRGII